MESHIEARKQAEGVQEPGTEKNLGLKREDVEEGGEKCLMRSFMVCTHHQML